MSTSITNNTGSIPCPVCNRSFENNIIEEHVNKCLFLNVDSNAPHTKRSNYALSKFSPQQKRVKINNEFPGSSKTKVVS